jgi:hypothetical protein
MCIISKLFIEKKIKWVTSYFFDLLIFIDIEKHILLFLLFVLLEIFLFAFYYLISILVDTSVKLLKKLLILISKSYKNIMIYI